MLEGHESIFPWKLKVFCKFVNRLFPVWRPTLDISGQISSEKREQDTSDKLEGSSDRFSLPAEVRRICSPTRWLFRFIAAAEPCLRGCQVDDCFGCYRMLQYSPFDLRFGNDRPGQRKFHCRWVNQFVQVFGQMWQNRRKWSGWTMTLSVQTKRDTRRPSMCWIWLDDNLREVWLSPF